MEGALFDVYLLLPTIVGREGAESGSIDFSMLTIQSRLEIANNI